MKIKRLDTIIKTNGHRYELHLRNETVALYRQYDISTDILVGYELIEIIIRNEEKIKDRIYPKRECYCPTSLWGQSGFTLLSNSSESFLRKRFDEFTIEILNRKNKKK